MTKIWVVEIDEYESGLADYEIFSTKEAAEKFIENYDMEQKFHRLEIVEKILH
jgi:hypothetical protein